MGKFIEFTDIKDPTDGVETLHISHRGIYATLLIVAFVDKETNQQIRYIPSFDLTSYGETTEKADEMLQFVLDDHYKYLMSLSQKSLTKELAKYGWSKNRLKNKDYSKVYVDIHGSLQDFNVSPEDLKIQTLTTA